MADIPQLSESYLDSFPEVDLPSDRPPSSYLPPAVGALHSPSNLKLPLWGHVAPASDLTLFPFSNQETTAIHGATCPLGGCLRPLGMVPMGQCLTNSFISPCSSQGLREPMYQSSPSQPHCWRPVHSPKLWPRMENRFHFRAENTWSQVRVGPASPTCPRPRSPCALGCSTQETP